MKTIMALMLTLMMMLVGMPGDVAAGYVRPGLHDATPPVLLSLDITPDVIDVTRKTRLLTITASVQDDFSGTSTVEVYFAGRMGSDVQPIIHASAPIIGDRLGGVFRMKRSIAPLSANGTWTVRFVRLQDLRNQRTYELPK